MMKSCFLHLKNRCLWRKKLSSKVCFCFPPPALLQPSVHQSRKALRDLHLPAAAQQINPDMSWYCMLNVAWPGGGGLCGEVSASFISDGKLIPCRANKPPFHSMTNWGAKMCRAIIKYSLREQSRVLPVDVGNANLFCCAAVRQTKSRPEAVSDCGTY